MSAVINAGWRRKSLEGVAAVLKLPEIGAEIPLARIHERTASAVAKG